jgi:hypothetical protein
MKRFSYTTALKAVLVGVVVSGMATACQNGDGAIGGFITKDDQATTGAKTGSAATQSDEERKAEQSRKIAEFLAKPEVKEMSAGLEEIAQAVAVAVEDKALTNRIYEKCMEKFDGETNTLWMHLEADGKLKSQGGWNKRVDTELSKGRKNTTVKSIGNIDAAVKKFEKTVGAPLHLFWMYPSGWDKKTTPLVAFVPFDANPKTRTSIPAFDAKGNRFELGKDGALAKKRPIIVIALNERTLPNGQIRSNIIANAQQPSSKSGAQTLSGNYVYLYTAQVNRSLWTDPDGEWEGQQEFFYLFESGEFTSNTNVYLGQGNSWKNKAVPDNTGNVTLPRHLFMANWGFTGQVMVRFTYYEADGLWFDDFIESHMVERSQFSGIYYTFPSATKVPAVYASF